VFTFLSFVLVGDFTTEVLRAVISTGHQNVKEPLFSRCDMSRHQGHKIYNVKDDLLKDINLVNVYVKENQSQ
jgi:hypothetical protein